MADTSILPGGRGERRGPDSLVDQAEAYDVRRRLDPLKDGWLLSTVGENIYTHMDVTGVLSPANQLTFFYVPDRMRRVLAHEVRVNVAVAVAGSTVRTALYIYDNAERARRLVKISGSEVAFDSSTTGMKNISLSRDIEVPIEAKLFIGRWCSSATIALEGYQSGAGTTPRVVRQRAVASVAAPLGSFYNFNEAATLVTNEDTPLVVYLSPDAAQVF